MIPSTLTIPEIMDNETVSNFIPNDLTNLLLIFFNENDWDEISDFLSNKLNNSESRYYSISIVYLMHLLDDLWKDFEKFNLGVKSDLESLPIN